MMFWRVILTVKTQFRLQRQVDINNWYTQATGPPQNLMPNDIHMEAYLNGSNTHGYHPEARFNKARHCLKLIE